jgi:hypothetical protein
VQLNERQARRAPAARLVVVGEATRRGGLVVADGAYRARSMPRMDANDADPAE